MPPYLPFPRFLMEADLALATKLVYAVLLDGELCAALLPPPATGRRRCRECKRIFTPPKHNTLYCPDCAAKRAKRSKREWARKKRAGV